MCFQSTRSFSSTVPRVVNGLDARFGELGGRGVGRLLERGDLRVPLGLLRGGRRAMCSPTQRSNCR